MKSKNKEKSTNNFKERMKVVKKKFREVIFKPEYIKVLEERDKMTFKQKIQEAPSIYIVWVFVIITIIVTLVFGIIAIVNEINKEPDRADTSTYLEKEVTGTTSEFVSKDITQYLVDAQGNTIKISMATIGENVAYSLKYNCDIPQDGQMTSSSYFVEEYVTTILANGYPYVDYEELGLESEEEAYIATQLAIYEIVQQQEYSMAQGEFSLDKVSALKDEYNDLAQRIITVSKELVSYAYENTYKDESTVHIDTQSTTLSVNGTTAIAGPYTITTSIDSSTKKITGDIEDQLTHDIQLFDYIDGTTSSIVDENGNKLSTVNNSTPFYIQIEGTEKIFTQFSVAANTYYLSSSIYKRQGDSSRYVVLEAKKVSYMDIFSISRNVDYGFAKINFSSDSEENITTIEYYIFDSDGNQVQQIYWDAYYMEIAYPVGTYYVVPYYIPDGYFLEQEKYEFEIVKGEITNVQINVDGL